MQDNIELLQTHTPIEVQPKELTLRIPNIIPLQTTKKKIANKDAFQFLQSLREFSDLPPKELKDLANYSRFTTLESGEYLTIEGNEESLYGFIVVSGTLAMSKNSSNGKELIVEILQEKDIFGLLLMLAKDRHIAQLSAKAIKNSIVLWIPLKEFIQLLKLEPLLLKEFSSHLLLCLQSSYNLSRGLAHDKVEVRIASILLSLVMKANFCCKEESNTICFTRQQLADLTGTTAETAIRVTRAMQSDGLIDIKRPGIIKVLNKRKLEEIVESYSN